MKKEALDLITLGPERIFENEYDFLIITKLELLEILFPTFYSSFAGTSLHQTCD